MNAATDNDADPGTTGINPQGGDESPTSARPFLDAIKDAQEYFRFWNEKSDGIDKLYADLKTLAADGGDREFQMFWANMEILKPSIYARPPVPVAVPRWKDQKELPRKASEVLERTLSVNFEEEDINAVMLEIRDDMATNGRGAVWIRLRDYDGQIRNCIEHLDRTDFLHEPARKWKEVSWVARRAWLSMDEGMQRFGDAFASVNLKSRKEMTGDDDQAHYEGEKKAEVWEIWSKRLNMVIWVSPGLETVLDAQPPHLQLEGFFPCPKPAYATTERRKLIPVPDFVYYKDQLEEINELTARISALAEALRLKGFYPGGQGELAEAIEAAVKRQDQNALLVPVSNFAALGSASLKDSIIWLPVSEVAETITNLVALRKQLIDDVYQITGLSDVMRGATDPDETLGAQQLKSQYGSIRIRDRQAELVRIARDITRISAEIMAENYTAGQFLACSQMDLPTAQMVQQQMQQLAVQAQQFEASPEGQQLAAEQPEMFQQSQMQAQQQMQQLQATVTIDQVMALFQEQKVRPYILEIETDSTIQPDEQAEKEARTEFVTALTGLLTQFAPLVAAMPAAAPFAGETLKFALAPFHAGRALEGAVEQFVETLKGQAQQMMQNPPPSDEQFKAEQADKDRDLDMRKHKDEMDMRKQEGARAHELAVNSHELAVRKARVEGDAAAAEGQPQANAYSSIELLEQMAAGQQQLAQAIMQLAQVMAAPKQVTTPEGRTYTTQPMTVN